MRLLDRAMAAAGAQVLGSRGFPIMKRNRGWPATSWAEISARGALGFRAFTKKERRANSHDPRGS